MQKNMVCPQCKGDGEIPLSETLQCTLGAIHALGGKATAPRLYEVDDWDGVGVSALNNRLEDLRKAGFVDRKRTHGGKGWTYFLIRGKRK